MSDIYNIPYIIDTIKEIRGGDPGKKELQKIVFLIEEKGVNLEFEYGLHFYGPYSAILDANTSFLSTEGIIDFHNEGFSHKMTVNREVCKRNKIEPTLNLQEETLIREVIKRFEDNSPSKLELLTTTIYAFNNLEDRTRRSIINGVKKIKGNKYSEEEIKKAINELDYFDKKVLD